MLLATREKNKYILQIYFEYSKIHFQTATVSFLTSPFRNEYTQGSVAGLCDVEWQRGGVIRLVVTGYAAGTGVHTAVAVASLMGFNHTRRQHCNGTVNPLR